MKKRLISLLLVFCMLCTLFPTTAFAADKRTTTTTVQANPFTDVKGSDWFYDAVQYAQVNGFFSGTSATTFDPNGTMTRGMFVTVLGRMAGIDAEAYTGQSAFSDVPADMYCAPYVAWAAKHDITGGTGEGKFSPNTLINRQQMAALFVRYFEVFDVNYETGANITTTPADIDSVAPYAKDAVLKLWKQGLLNGDGTSFNPNGKASRAEAATLTMRTDQAVETWYKEPGVTSDRVSIDPAQGEDKTDTPVTPPAGGGGGGGAGGSTTTSYEVSFDLGEGQSKTGVTMPETQTYAKGTKINLLPTPYKQNSVFLGWYYNPEMTLAAGNNDTVTKSMTLYAKMGETNSISEQETPNYATVIVKAGDVADYTFGIQGYTDDCVEYFTHISGMNAAMPFEINGTKVSADLKQGQTYSIKLMDDSAARLIVNNEVQPASIRVLNIITEKATAQNLKLDKENMIFIPKGDVSGMSASLSGLFSLSMSNDANGNTVINQVNDTGSFTYSKGQLNIGDLVAIYEGDNPAERNINTDNDSVAYIEITGKNGSTYTYKTANTEDILFIPDILPVSSNITAAAMMTTNGGITEYNLTVNQEDMQFTDDIYAEMGLDSQTTIDAGDFIAIYNNKIEDETATLVGYGKIKTITEGELNGKATYNITYVNTTFDEIQASMDIYHTRNEAISLTQEQEEEIELKMVQQAVESGFVDEAAEYLTALALETDGFQELSDDLDMDLASYSISFKDGTPVDPAAMNLQGVDVDVEKEIHPNLMFGTLSHFEDSTGIRAELVMNLTITIGGGDKQVVIEMEAVFEQEVMLNINVSGGAVWKWAWIFPYIADYEMNANLDLGTFTGIGITATAKTGSGDDDEEGFDWDTTTDNEYGTKVVNIGKQIKDMIEKKNEFMDMITIPTVGLDGEDAESKGSITTGGLAEKYADMMENAEESWIDIVRIQIFQQEGFVDYLHILCYGIGADFVISANMYVTIGMTFEHGVAKRYNFCIKLFSKDATNETVDLEENHYQFDFYVMGTLGLRAGIEFEVGVGLFSLSIDSVGITAEAGAYAQLWGYFYYSLTWNEEDGKNSSYSGAMYIEIGTYLSITFKAQLFSNDDLTYQPSIYENQWPLLSVGEAENVYDFAYPDDDEMLTLEIQSARNFSLSSDLFNMNYMDLTSGELYGSDSDSEDDEDEEPDNDPGNYDTETDDHFTIELSNPLFSYNPNGNMITVRPAEDSYKETCEVTIRWKNSTLAFSSQPIERTLTIEWSDPDNVRYISFNSKGGSAVEMVVAGPGEPITKPANPTKTGYTFGDWYQESACVNKFDFPATMPDYSSQNGDKGITVYAKWIPRNDTKYTVEHYQQQLNGTYKLTDTDNLIGTTDAYTAAAAKELTGNYQGFKANSFAQARIAPNGPTVIKIYYTREVYTVSFTYGDFADDNAALTYRAKYGSTIYAPTMSLGGYVFEGFKNLTTDANGGLTVTGTAEYQAKWSPATDTPYRIEHYIQRVNGNGYLLAGNNAIQSLSGKTDSIINVANITKLEDTGLEYTKATVDGEEISGSVNATIAANGKTVVKLYYDRNSFDFILMSGNEEISSTPTVYGQVLPTPSKPVNPGYTFVDWYTDAECTEGNEFTFGTATMPAKDLTLYAKWSANTNTPYTVEHYQQKVSGDGYDKVDTDNLTGTTGTLTAAVAKDYSAYGFKAATDFEQTAIAASGTVIKIYYDRVSYDVNFITNSDSEIDELTDVLHGARITAPTAPTKTGYDFAGWYKDEELQTAWNFNSDTVTADTTLYAKWTPATNTAYTVKHYQQDIGSENYTFIEADNKTGTTGTQTAAAAKNYEGFAAQAITQQTIAADGSTIVEIRYTRNQYDVTVKNDEQATGTTTPYYYGEEVTVPAAPTNEGYTFTHWTDNRQNWQPGATFTMSAEEVTLTAQWKANTYTVKFDNNSNKLPVEIIVSGSMADQTFTYDEDKALTANAYTLPEFSGYTFIGWATTADGAVTYTDRQSVENLTAEANDTVTLYAVWQQGASVSYTVKHYQQNIGGGENYTLIDADTQTINGIMGTMTQAAANTYAGFTKPEVANVEITGEGIEISIKYTRNLYDVTVKNDEQATGTTTPCYYGEEVTVPAAPTKEGHTFTGWSNGSRTLQPGDTFTVGTAAVTLTAQWNINQYTITFNTNGGSEIADITQDYNSDIIAPAAPAREGYTFTGWDKEIPAKMPVDGLTVNANWNINQYTITFNTNGGSTIADITQDYNSDIIAPAAPTREGYTFTGWDKEIPAKMPADNLTIEASWSANTYSIIFNANGGTGTMADQERTYDVQATLNSNSFSRTGFEFKGWATDADGSVVYANGANPGNMTTVNNAEITLYAVWEAITYNLNYSGEGVTAEAQSGKMGDEITLAGAPANRTGYEFTGWIIDDTVYAAGTAYTMPADHVTAAAKWTAIEYTITYTLGENAENNPNNPTEYTVEESFTLGAPSRIGFVFTGWTNTELIEPTPNVTIAKGTTGNLSFKANWEASSYTVNFVGLWDGNDYTLATMGDINHGDIISCPEAAIKTAATSQGLYCIFKNWYIDRECTTPYDFANGFSTESSSTVINLYSPGSAVTTADDLTTLIAAAPTDGTQTVIAIGADIQLSGKITLPQHSNILIKSALEDTKYTLTTADSSNALFYIYDTTSGPATKLTIQGLEIETHTVEWLGPHAIENYNGILNVSDCEFTCEVYGAVLSGNGSDTTLTNCTIYGAGIGAAVECESGSTVKMTNCTVTCTPLSGRTANAVTNTGTITMEGCTFSNGSNNGGAVMNYQNGSITMTDCTFSNNRATNGGAVYNKGNITMTDCTFNNNTAAGGNGGAIANEGTITMSGCEFTGNTAGGNGGAVYNNGTKINKKEAPSDNKYYITSDTTTIYAGDITMTDCTFSGNTASGNGGALFNSNTLAMGGCAFNNNTATGSGGAVYNTSSSESTTEEEAHGYIYTTTTTIYAGTITMTGSEPTYSGNSSTANANYNDIYNGGTIN